MEDETGNEYQRISQEHIEIMDDYTQALLDIKALRTKAYAAMQDSNWSVACDCADEIIVAARKVRIYSFDQLERQ